MSAITPAAVVAPALPAARSERATTLLAAGLVILPLLQAFPIDFDRSALLFVLFPALWAGRASLSSAWLQLAQLPRWTRLLLLAALALVILSVAFAAHPAPAAVTAASWLFLAATALLASRLVQTDATAHARLLAAIALGSAFGTLLTWLLWTLGGRGQIPLYAHHRHLGLHTLAGACAATALLVRPALPRSSRIVWAAVGIITWAGLFWSGGRGPVLALCGALAFWAALSARPQRRALFLWATLQLFAGLGLSALFATDRPELGWWHAFERTAGATKAANVSALTSTRSEFWQEAFRHGLASPWLGHGPDAYRFLTPKLDGQQPHNLLLQLWLDLGLLGGLAFLTLLAALLFRATRRAWTARGTSPETAWLTLLVAALLIGMLDGAFYHLLLFLPASIAAGTLLPHVAPPTNAAAKSPALPVLSTILPRILLGITTSILLIHAAIFHTLANATPPAPSALAPRLLHAFPSTTFGLWRWLDSWKTSHPDDEFAWTRWAQAHASNPALFHIRAAQTFLARGDRAGAIAELRAALAKAHYTAHGGIRSMLDPLERIAP